MLLNLVGLSTFAAKIGRFEYGSFPGSAKMVGLSTRVQWQITLIIRFNLKLSSLSFFILSFNLRTTAPHVRGNSRRANFYRDRNMANGPGLRQKQLAIPLRPQNRRANRICCRACSASCCSWRAKACCRCSTSRRRHWYSGKSMMLCR